MSLVHRGGLRGPMSGTALGVCWRLYFYPSPSILGRRWFPQGHILDWRWFPQAFALPLSMFKVKTSAFVVIRMLKIFNIVLS